MTHEEHTSEQAKNGFEAVGPAGAQVLLLIDDSGAGGATWNTIDGPLAEQFRLVRPAQVKTAGVTDIAALGQAAIQALDSFGFSRAHVAGCGLGGLVALWLAIHHPDRVSRLAVIAAGPSPESNQGWAQLADEMDGAQTPDQAAHMLIGKWLTPGLRERDSVLVHKLEATIKSQTPKDIAGLARAAARIDLRQDLGRITAPTLFLCGDEDQLVDFTNVDEMLEDLAQARLERVAKAAHLITVEQPARVLKALFDHFGSAANLDAGFRSRRVALGDPHVDKTIAAITPFTRSFQDFLTRYCWGEVWPRAGLSRRDRSLATISALVAIGAEHEIPVHVRAGLRHGLKIEEFPELYEQLALYTGLPRAFGALNITQKTLFEDGLLDPKARA